jgi:putative membrane protein
MMNDGAYGWLAMLIPLVVLAAVIGTAIYLMRTYVGHSRTTNGVRDPLDIARERYAKGEITKDELAEIKRELK